MPTRKRNWAAIGDSDMMPMSGGKAKVDTVRLKKQIARDSSDLEDSKLFLADKQSMLKQERARAAKDRAKTNATKKRKGL